MEGDIRLSEVLGRVGGLRELEVVLVVDEWNLVLAEERASLIKKSGYPSLPKADQSMSSSGCRCSELDTLKALRNRPLRTPFFTEGAW